MRKKLTSVGCILIFSLFLVAGVDVKATEDISIDGSRLTHQEESVGYMEQKTRGQYLMAGYSKCVQSGEGKIYAGGTTIAAKEVESVQVSVIIERAQKGDKTWESYESWDKINHNTDRVSANRAVAVEGGYYYRVRSLHSANSDVSSSYTDGIYIE